MAHLCLLVAKANISSEQRIPSAFWHTLGAQQTNDTNQTAFANQSKHGRAIAQIQLLQGITLNVWEGFTWWDGCEGGWGCKAEGCVQTEDRVNIVYSE